MAEGVSSASASKAPTRATGEDGWERHAQEQREGWLRASPAQRLAWLEEAIELASRAGALPRRSVGDARSEE